MARHKGSTGYEAAAEAIAQTAEGSLFERVPQTEVPSAGSPPATHVNGTPVSATKPAKPKRRMSTGLQICARIERILAELDDKTFNSVLRWIKDIEARKSDASQN